MEAQTVAQLQRPGQSVLLDGMALDHLWLRLPFGVDAVKRIEHEIGGVSRRPRPGDDRIQHRKIRDPDKDEGFRAIRSPEAGRNANRKRRGRGSFKQIASSHSGFSPRLQTEGPISRTEGCRAEKRSAFRRFPFTPNLLGAITDDVDYRTRPRRNALRFSALRPAVSRVALAPVEQGPQHRAQLLAFLGQQVFGARRVLLIEPPLDDPGFLQPLQSR